MILLTSTTDKLQVITGSAGSIRYYSAYTDLNAGVISPAKQALAAAITTATTTDITAAPAASTQRNVRHLVIYNDSGSVANAITIQITDGTNTIKLWQGTLAITERVVFDEIGGWTYYDATGKPYTTGVPFALQADMEAATSLVLAASPGNLKWHPGVAKAWCMASGDGLTNRASLNVSGLTDNGTGDLTVSFSTVFSSATYAVQVAVEIISNTLTAAGNVQTGYIKLAGQAAGSIRVNSRDATATTNVLRDPTNYHVTCDGDQ